MVGVSAMGVQLCEANGYNKYCMPCCQNSLSRNRSDFFQGRKILILVFNPFSAKPEMKDKITEFRQKTIYLTSKGKDNHTDISFKSSDDDTSLMYFNEWKSIYYKELP